MTDRAPRISRATARRMTRLLNMEYKPSEIAEELGVTQKTIYDTYIPAGLPHRRDATGNIWIVGINFVKWARAMLETGERKPKQALGENQAYCMSCNTARDFERITRRVPKSKNRVLVYGICSVCGGKMVAMRKGTNDKP